MLRATVEINLEGAAFFDDDTFNPAPEIARILRHVANELDKYQPSANVAVWGMVLRDINGNDAGRFETDCAIPEES